MRFSILLVAYVLFCLRICIHVLALPISSEGGKTLTAADSSSSDTRSTYEIVWSCLATIFLCTWVAVHPNVPRSEESTFKNILRRTKDMVSAVLIPELLITWAAREWVIARKMTKHLRRRKWTMTHSFFFVMGGLVTQGGGDRPTLTQLKAALKKGEIVLTERQIQDKSKNDGLSKGVVLLQISWFASQFIARCVQHLPITEVELVTVAYALVSFVTYGLWWNKPSNVQCPIPIYVSTQATHPYTTSSTMHASTFATPRRSVSFTTPSTWIPQPPPTPTELSSQTSTSLSLYYEKLGLADTIRRPSRAMTRPAPTDRREVPLAQVRPTVDEPVPNSESNEESPRESVTSPELDSPAPSTGEHVQAEGMFSFAIFIRNLPQPLLSVAKYLVIFFTKLPKYILSSFQGFLKTFIILRAGEDGTYDLWRTLVPLSSFFGRPSYRKLVPSYLVYPICLLYLSGIGFGVIHCFGWSLQFPTHAERLLWRIISITITAIPAFLLVQILFLLRGWLLWFRLFNYIALLYIPARIILIVLALMSLRSLPPEVHRTVEWSKFIPHL